MSRVMVVGPSGSGKTTLLRRLGLWEGKVGKTESVVFSSRAIDTPGEYANAPRFFGALIFSSYKAKVVLFVVSAVDPRPFPPGLAGAFRGVKIGVVNKVDLLGEVVSGSSMEVARKVLLDAGVSEVHEVSALTGQGMDGLCSRVLEILESGEEEVLGA